MHDISADIILLLLSFFCINSFGGIIDMIVNVAWLEVKWIGVLGWAVPT